MADRQHDLSDPAAAGFPRKGIQHEAGGQATHCRDADDGRGAYDLVSSGIKELEKEGMRTLDEVLKDNCCHACTRAHQQTQEYERLCLGSGSTPEPSLKALSR